MDDNVDDLKKHHDTILSKLQDISDRDYKTKTELVKELIDVSRPLIKSGLIKGLKQKDLSIYINAKLIENGIKYVRNERFYDLFTEKEKHIEFGSNVSSLSVRAHEHNFVGTEFEKICECGDIIRVGKHYTIADEPLETETETAEYTIDLKQKEKKESTDPYENLNTEMLIRQANLCKDMACVLEDQIKKYYRYENIAKSIDEVYTDEMCRKIIDEAKSAEAKMIHADKQQDIRQKVGEFEKLMAYILEETTYNVAKVAKLISITPKHLTNNVNPEVKQIINDFNWFKTLSIPIPNDMKKGEILAIDIASWFDHMMVRKGLSMEMRQPLLKSKWIAFW
tara:strand:+ start:4387 stop:5400 length:1014 start_codon:yes stop_codon:yes gene_type:complete